MERKIDETYCECFEGIYSRMLITAADEKRLKRAAYQSTALPLTVLGESEGGVEGWVNENQTPDHRLGALIQIWVMKSKNAIDNLEIELGKRIRQGILVTPTTRLFNATDSNTKINMMRRVGHCGDGYEEIVRVYGREMINIPIMMGFDFQIEKEIGYSSGVMGGNLWFLCDSVEAGVSIGDKAIEAISKVKGVITPFDTCSAGSKVGGKYPEIGPTTNHPYCPTLKNKISDYKVPEGVKSIPEIVIDGINLEVVKEAMKKAIEAVINESGLVKITAGNYGGKLGKYKIFLNEL
ncbi:MAG: formylmethanofuran--tetrahydromethanopterin N-formyltransferase [Candidatus Odinarchaeia archaeon]